MLINPLVNLLQWKYNNGSIFCDAARFKKLVVVVAVTSLAKGRVVAAHLKTVAPPVVRKANLQSTTVSAVVNDAAKGGKDIDDGGLAAYAPTLKTRKKQLSLPNEKEAYGVLDPVP